jgi:hypothetical protein
MVELIQHSWRRISEIQVVMRCAEGAKQTDDGEISRLDHGAILELPHRSYGHPGPRGELFLAQPRFLADLP